MGKLIFYVSLKVLFKPRLILIVVVIVLFEFGYFAAFVIAWYYI